MEFSLAVDVGTSWMTACFHCWGILPVDRHRLHEDMQEWSNDSWTSFKDSIWYLVLG